ncbi:MAG: MobF family relaxase [Acidimicrobiales bacterium]
MLTITKLKSAEYLIRSVAEGLEDYYMGAGEAPGVWRGEWAAELGLHGVVEAPLLRALVNGHDPATARDWLEGHRTRTVAAIDVTLSCPKSVSLLWAFGTEETSTAVSLAVVDAVDVALELLEGRAAFTRRQEGGVRHRVGTHGFAVATFAHRTSRAGDPQLHTHCLIPNIVRRADGEHVAFDGNLVHVWGKAAGTVFLNELERGLTARLGVAWGPDRNGTREMVGFTAEQIRRFSKRTVAIETRLEAAGEVVFDSKKARMQADERASLDTRGRKDKTLTPERLRDRWNVEAATVDLQPGATVDDLVVGRQISVRPGLSDDDVFVALVDPETGLCATDSRFNEAHVVERVAAMSGGRMTAADIVDQAQRFLASGLVVRLAPDVGRRRPPEWCTVEHRAVEDQLLAHLHRLAADTRHAVEPACVHDAVAAEPVPLGEDQAAAVRVLCGAGPAVRSMLAPAGFGKTTAVHAAVRAQLAAGRRVVVVAPTHKAVAALRGADVDAQTIARFLVQIDGGALAADTTMVLDEVSQVGTRQAAAVLDAVARSPGGQLWCVGDAGQTQSASAGGLAAEIEALATARVIASATLTSNRRQADPVDQKALAKLRAGDVVGSRTLRTGAGWEHEHATSAETQHALARAGVADADRYGARNVVVLAVSHADCEDLADRIRALLAARGELRGPTVHGPGWGPDPRIYAAGDRILLHTNHAVTGVCNGSTGTILGLTHAGAHVLFDDYERHVFVEAAVFAGRRRDGTPNMSHAWARTIDGAQGGTWHQVHLLGTAALDRYRGYVGQSRSRRPTHTWNTRPEVDHPAHLLADQRSPAEVVAGALGRAEPKTFAAGDDPWVLNRRLRAERDEHAAAAATRPPDRNVELQRARQDRDRAEQEQRRARQEVADRHAERAKLGLLRQLRRGGRSNIARAQQAVAGAQRHLERAGYAAEAARARVAEIEDAVAERAVWDRANGWRLERIAVIDDTLAHHWAGVVLRAVHADDPLAFGIDRLRAARATYATDLGLLQRQLPTDRSHALAAVRRQLQQRQQRGRAAEQAERQSRAALDEARQRRRWGRRNEPSVDAAEAAAEHAHTHAIAARAAVRAVEKRVSAERQALRESADVASETTEERLRIEHALRDIDDTLAATRAERVLAAARDPQHPLWATLGPPPQTRGGLAAWCGIADRLEARDDDHPSAAEVSAVSRALGDWYGRRDRERVLHDVGHIIDIAGRHDPERASAPPHDPADWHAATERAQHTLEATRAREVAGRGLELGL